MASIAFMDDIHQQFSKHFLFKICFWIFLIFRKKYADGVFTQGSYLKSINVKVTGYINMILNFIEQKTLALFKLSNFKCICHFNYQKIPFVISKSNGGKRGSFFRIFCLTFWCLCQVEGHGGTLAKLFSENCQKFP